MRTGDLSLTEDSILELQITPPLDVNGNFKDVLLASLYAQVDFLRSELEEKTYSLIIQESQVYTMLK